MYNYECKASCYEDLNYEEKKRATRQEIQRTKLRGREKKRKELGHDNGQKKAWIKRERQILRERSVLPDSLNKHRVIPSSKYNPPEQPSDERDVKSGSSVAEKEDEVKGEVISPRAKTTEKRSGARKPRDRMMVPGG